MQEIKNIYTSKFKSLLFIYLCLLPGALNAQVVPLKTLSESYFFVERKHSDHGREPIDLKSHMIDQKLGAMWGFVKTYGERTSYGPIMIRFRHDQSDVLRRIKLTELFPGYLVTPVSDILETQQAESLVDQELEALNREIHDFTKAGRIDSFEARYAIAIRILELSSREYFFGETVVRHLVKIQALMKDKDPQMKHVIDVHLEKLLKSPFGGVPLQIASAYFERIGKVLSLLKIANYETDSELNPVVWHLRDILDRSVDGIYRSFQKLPRALRTKAIFGFRTKILVAGHGEGFRALRDPEIKNEAYQDFEALSLVGLKNREVDLIKTWIRSLEFDSATHEYPLAQERIEVALEHLDSESFLAVMNVALSENMTVEFATTNEYLRYVVALTEMLNKLRLDPHFPLAKFKTGLAPALVSFEKRAESLFASKDGSIHPLTDSLLNRLYRNLRLLHDERIGQQMCLQILKSL